MGKVLDEALDTNNVQIRETAMQCLVEIGRQEYATIQSYMEKIW